MAHNAAVSVCDCMRASRPHINIQKVMMDLTHTLHNWGLFIVFWQQHGSQDTCWDVWDHQRAAVDVGSKTHLKASSSRKGPTKPHYCIAPPIMRHQEAANRRAAAGAVSRNKPVIAAHASLPDVLQRSPCIVHWHLVHLLQHL